MKKLEKYIFLIAIIFLVNSMASANSKVIVEVPMKFRGVMPAVEVMVNGQGPYLFAIDTGGQGQARADTTLVEKLKLKKVGEVQAGDGSGKNTRTLDVVGMDSIKIGDLEFKDVRALTRNYNRSPRVPPIDGILGFNLFEDYLLTLDFLNKKVSIIKGELPKANGKDILDFAGSDGIPSIELNVGGQKIKAHIDSGNMVGAFVLPTEIVEKMSLIGEPKILGRARTISNTIEIKQAKLKDNISFGQFEFTQPEVIYPALRSANIGSKLLKEFSITFDQKNKRLKLKRAKPQMSANTAVCWNKRKLSWDDFQGEVTPRFRRAGMQAAITDAEIRYRKVDGTYKIEAVFNRKNSWMVGRKTESGLNHEQLHFDLAEAFARKARAAIGKMKNASDLDIALKIESIMAEHDVMQMKYDQDVQMRGLDRTEQQNIWNKKVADLLEEYKGFSTNEPCKIPTPGTNLTEDDRKLLIARILKLVDEKFVDIPAGKKVIAGISQNLKAGKYKNLTNDELFRRSLTKDLYDLSKDLHLSIRTIDRNPLVSAQTSQSSNGRVRRGGGGQRVEMGQNPNGQTIRRGNPNGSPQMRRMSGPRLGGRTINRPAEGHFIGRILEGNIGYVKVNGALYPMQGSQVKQDMENALQTVKNADAVIFDLRNVPGGVPDTISLLSSYLYDDKPKLLNTYYHRTRGANELKTEPEKVPFHFGEKLPVYVLINSRTASGGEAFTYLNQQHGRVTVAGETSRGAGRLSAVYPISQTLSLMVPENRSEHPVSKTGFEKVGVKPDIKSKSEDSLYTAHIIALERLSGKDNAIAKVKNARNELLKKQKEVGEKLKEYVGVYGIRTIVVGKDGLIYRKEGQMDLGLKEVSKDKYKLVVPPNVRTAGELPSIRFDRDSNGKVVSFSLIKADGSVQGTFKKGK